MGRQAARRVRRRELSELGGRGRAVGALLVGALLVAVIAAAGPVGAAPGRARARRRTAGTLVGLVAKADDPRRRETAAVSLGVAGDRSALPALHRCLAKDKDRWVRAACAEALGLIGDKRSVSKLRSSLSREKHDRVRRAIAVALMRLGQKKGLLELMWQLKSGTNHERAEAMHHLAETFGRPGGQHLKRWWTYLAHRGYAALARRPGGSPAFVELRGPKAKRSPRLVVGKPVRWRQLCAAVIRLAPTRAGVDARVLRAYDKRHGPIPDGCLLLVASGWRRAARAGARDSDRAKRQKPTAKKARSKNQKKHAVIPGPGLTADGWRFLRRRAPHLLGVGIDAPRLDVASAKGQPVKAGLEASGLIGLVGVGALDRPLGKKLRLLVVQEAAATKAGRPVVVLAVLR